MTSAAALIVDTNVSLLQSATAACFHGQLNTFLYIAIKKHARRINKVQSLRRQQASMLSLNHLDV